MEIKLSLQHGVNPSLELCFICGDPAGVVLFGKLPGDRKAPHKVVLSSEPCSICKDWMRKGVILISIKDGEGDMEDPYRTGGWVVITEDAFKRAFQKYPSSLLEKVLAERYAFVEDSIWDSFGFPCEKEEDTSIR